MKSTGARLALLVLLLLRANLGAQGVLRGQVIDDATSAPVQGALVSVFDASGQRVGSAFVDATGEFTLRPLPAGSYSVGAEMIGRHSITQQVTVSAGTVSLALRMPSDPVSLRGIDVTVGRRCPASDSQDPGIALVWGEVQKALRAAALTRDQALYRFSVAAHERQVDARSLAIVEDVTQEGVVTGYDPFKSLPPEEVAARGYVTHEKGDLWIYGPNIAVLLSKAFEDTHCFGLRRDVERGVIGVTFEPTPRRSVTDIQGVLWLDDRTNELKTLDFEYVRLPRDFVEGDYTGYASFRRLDSGSWTIDGWWLRSPDARRPNRLQERSGEILETTRVPGGG